MLKNLLSQLTHKWTVGYSTMLILLSVYTCVVLNWLFLYKIYQAVSLNSAAEWLFLLSVPIVLFCLCLIIYSWLALVIFIRPLVIISLVVSSILLYASVYYGVIFDKNMIKNIVETDTGEALAYLNWHLVIFVVFVGALPAYLLSTKTCRIRFVDQLKSMAKINAFSLVTVALIASVLYQTYASVGRNNRDLTGYIVPFAFYLGGYKHLRDSYFYPPLPFQLLDKHPELIEHKGKNISVIVVGETARADHFSLAGYPVQTNRFTSNDKVKFFSKVSSCGTATAISVPCMFARLNHAEFSNRLATSQENVLDIVNRAGAEVIWIDNNSSCKGVCARIESTQIEPDAEDELCDGKYCFDEILLKHLSARIQQSDRDNLVIVLHMIGSHGPTYYRRYPADFNLLQPDCQRSDVQNCSHQQLVNTYDNTIAYTDYVLHQVIAILQQTPAQYKSMLYVSDHGESLGEKGLYLHGFPYQIAPEEQTHVPMIYWSNLLENERFESCVNQKLVMPLSHDNFFDMVMGISLVTSKTYRSEYDVLADCRKSLI